MTAGIIGWSPSPGDGAKGFSTIFQWSSPIGPKKKMWTKLHKPLKKKIIMKFMAIINRYVHKPCHKPCHKPSPKFEVYWASTMGWWRRPPICGRLVGMVYSWVYKKEIEIETFSYYLGIIYIYIYIYYCFFSWGTKLLSCILIYIYMYIVYVYIYIIHILIELYSPCLLHVHDEPLLNHWSLGQPSIGMMATSAGPGQRPMRPQPKPKQLAPQKCHENGDL